MVKRPVIMQHVSGLPNSGGPVVALDRILRHSALKDYEFHRLHQIEPAGGINVKLLNAFRKEIKKVSPDLIHVRGLGNEGFHGVLAARLAGVPNILVSMHGTVRDLKFPASRVRHALVRDVLEPATLSMATHIITVCEYAAARGFLSPYKSKFMGVVANGVNLPVIPDIGRMAMRHALGIQGDEVVAVCVSRLTREKGYFFLAEALRQLPKLQSPMKILIVGNGPDRDAIEKEMQGIKGVGIVFLGQRDDVASILGAGDFFIFPSLHENLSNALLEAMSYGLPAVATAVGGNVEVIAHGGGVLVPVDDSDALSRAIAEYVNDAESRLMDGIKARNTVEGHYTSQHMAEGLSAVYQGILFK